jgi:hypothetical protein
MQKIIALPTDNFEANPLLNAIIQQTNQLLRSKGKTFRFNSTSALTALSSVFGIDLPNDQDRYQIVSHKILPLLAKQPEIVREITQILPRFDAWSASGRQRFMGIGLALLNMRQNRNIFSLDVLKSIQDEQVKKEVLDYITNFHPVYSLLDADNTLDKELKIQLPHKEKYRLLDIGSAPKADGPPTLLLLQSMLKGQLDLELIANDLTAPYFKISPENKIEHSDYVDANKKHSDGGLCYKSSFTKNNITWDNATEPAHNILGKNFYEKEKFDFITICMTLHHLIGAKENQVSLKKMPITTFKVVDEAGKPMKTDLMLTPTQQKVFDKMLTHLEIGGLLFANISVLHLDKGAINKKIQLASQANADLFFIFQRLNKNTVKLYATNPIAFCPSIGKLDLARDNKFIDGKKTSRWGRAHIGIGSYYNLNENQKEQLNQCFFEAQKLAVKYQSWKKSIWKTLGKMIELINKKADLNTLFAEYLKHVPLNSRDYAKKQALLAKVNEFRSA